MDEFLTALLCVLIVSLFWAAAAFAVMAVLALAAAITLILLPGFVSGFVSALRERKVEDSNPNDRSHPTG